MELTKLIDEWLMPDILKDKTKKIKKIVAEVQAVLMDTCNDQKQRRRGSEGQSLLVIRILG